ncbi:baseplate J/gp47 family protein [Paraburkholderia caribensis]|uniref:baseplate J/gp47 family protein n=1 Tax=Paraburkholderia caribensis TaxID=75105 RepID=UPI001D08BDF1|nr:baseplate J/gp47 family protein [Paraburkholderia caribensis]
MNTTKPIACYCGVCATCAASGVVPRPAVADPLEYAHGAIKRRLLESIASTEIDGKRPLERLTTREDDDAAIALIDAFAASMHVVAWYVARMSDDGSILRTQDREALVDLTRLLGYEARPALSATTTLVFTVDEADATGASRQVPQGTKIASVPAQNELPQVFETDADLEARREWNALRPALQKDWQTIDDKAPELDVEVADLSMAVKVGDAVIVWSGKDSKKPWLYARVLAVVRKPDSHPPDTTPSRTVITLASMVAVEATNTTAEARFKNHLIVLGERAAAFGVNAPDPSLFPKPVPDHPSIGDQSVDLDAVHADAVKGAFVLFERTTGALGLARIAEVKEWGVTGGGLSAKVTHIGIVDFDLKPHFKGHIRTTAIYLETGRYALLQYDRDEPMPGPSQADRITVAGAVSLPSGRRVVLSGEQWVAKGTQGDPVAEVATVRSCESAGADTVILFKRAVSMSFRSTQLSISANAVSASHGETPAAGAELLGSSSATAATPRFGLKRSPLTYVPSQDARGYRPALEVRVGNRLYDETPTLFGKASADRVYHVRPLRDGSSEVRFAGRLPTGANNVTALYRTGGGLAGNLASGRLITPMTPVLGVPKVANPIAAEGGSDAEGVEDLRAGAQQSIRTLERVVSLADYEAFARTRRGVGKALATELQVGMRSVVCLTIATTTFEPPAAGSDIADSLRDALVHVSPPGRSVRIDGFTKLTATIVAALAIDPAYRRGDVEAQARAVLRDRFAAVRRRFGEALHRSAVLAALQSVEGVLAARLDTFALPGGPAESEGRLLCSVPHLDDGQFVAAGLLVVDADTVQFVGMAP